MTNVQEALKVAIEAMENEDDLKPIPFGIRCIRAINKCKSALAEIEKCEPVGWYKQHPRLPEGFYETAWHWSTIGDDKRWKPFYTSPQPRDWVSLTDEQKNYIRYHHPIDLVNATEAKCKQLNTKG